MRTIRLPFCLLLALAATATARAEEGAKVPWWDARWEMRVPILVQETRGLPRRKAPVVIEGRRLARALRSWGYRVQRMRLIADGEEIPFQVDERDRTGVPLFAGAANGMLDPDDELVFLADVDAKAARRFDLYVSLTDRVPPARYESPLRWEQTLGGKEAADLCLSNGEMLVGTRGGPGLVAFGGHGKGCVTRLALGEKELVHIGYSWGNQLFSSPQLGALAWSSPIPVLRGPVRALMLCRAPGFEAEWNGQAVTGDAYRFFTLYADRPLLEIEQEIRFRQTPAEPLAVEYRGTLSPSGRMRDWPAERIFLGDGAAILSGDTRTPALQTEPKRFNWLALQNPARRCGVAVFLPPGQVAERTVSLLPSHATMEKTMESVWGSMHSQAEFRFRLRYDPAETIRSRFGLIGLGGESPEEIAALHTTLWVAPLGQSITILPMELRDE